LSLTYVRNTGAAFGILKGQQWFFVVLSIGIIWWIGRALCMSTARPVATQRAMALILGGAIGNLIDRIRLGYVIDFIDLHVWPVFNVGDSAITIGVVLLLLHNLTGSGRGARGAGRGSSADVAQR
jgi:signal peptidase II